MDGRPDSLRSGSTTDVVAAAPPRETFEYPVREDAVLTLTLNLLDQTLAEIHQEFPPGRRPSAGKTPRTEVTSSTTTAPTSHAAFPRLPETTSSSKTMPWDSSPPAQPTNSTTYPDIHRDAFGSRMTAEINDPDRYLRRMLDRQDSFNRPGSSLFPETLPLPKDSVLQRYRRKKKTKSSASSSSSSSSSSSTSSSSRDEGEGNGAAGAKRSPRIGRRQTRRQRMNIRSEDGAAAAAGAGGESKTKTRTSQRRRRAEERSDGEKDRQTYKQADIQVAKGITNALSSNLDLVAAAEPITSGHSVVAETWLTLAAAGPSQDPLQVFDSVYPSSSKKLSHETHEHSACIVTPSDALESQVQSGVTPNMIGTIYANSVSDSERTGKSAVHRSFRNLGRSVDGDGDSADLASGVSPRGMQYRTSASSPSNQRSLASRSHSSGSCSPADTSTRAKNLTPFSRRERRIGENRSPATEEQQQHQQVVNEHNRSQHHHHHLSSSSDRLYATASADEEVFLARVRQSASPSQKLSDDASHQSGVGPSRIRIRSKESLSSGAHGCDHRTGVESPLNPERVHSDSDRGGGGPRVESSSFTGSVRLTLKQRSEDLTDDGGGPQKIRTLSTRTNSSTGEFPGVIRAQSKAISYESICLKIKEEAAENPKTIQVISLSQPPKFVSASKAVLLGESQINHGPKDSRNPPCSASQVCDVQFPDAGISSRPAQRDHSTKHRSNVFFSSKKSASGSHTDLSQVESTHLLPVQMSKVSSLPAKLIKRNAGAVNLKTDLGQSSKISELRDNNKPGKVITLNKKSHDVTLHTSTQTFTKSEDRQKATIIVNAEHGATSDKRLSKMGSTEQPPLHFELSPNRLGKESKFFLRCDQQPRTADQLIMGTVFTDRHTPRQNLLFPGTDFTPRDNSNSGRTSDTKASQNSKSVSQTQIDASVHDINDQLSQLDRNPESFEPSSTSEITNRTVVASGNDDYDVEITSKSATGASKSQGPSSQMQPTMDIVSEKEISTTRGLAMTEDKREGSTRVDGSLVVSTKDAMVGNVLSEDKRVERTEHIVKPEVRVVRGGLARTRSIPSLEIIEENSTSSTTTTTLSSSTNPTSPTKVTTSSRPIISAKEAQNIERVSHDDHVSNYTGDAGNLVQAFPKNDVQKETLVDSERLPLLKMAKTDSSMVGLKKKTVEKEKARRVVRFVSQDEMLEYSPTEFRDSSTPTDLPAKKHCSPFSATESDALSASMEPATKRFPDAPFIGDSHLKSPRKDSETFEDFLLKSPKKDSETLEDFLLKSPKKDSETLEDFLLKSPKKDSETLEDFLLKSPKKDPETSRDDASKSSPSAGKTTTTTTTTTTKPCIVRKQLIHLDSALHPSSCVPPDSTPVEARWSPKLVRKLNLADAKDVNVSDLDVAPDLMDFLSKEMEKVSVDVKQPDHGETMDELETGTQGIASLSRQRKPPLSLPLPLKSSEREEEDARSSSASAVDINPVKTEPEVGKRKFFSALKANAASFRAKKVLPSSDDPSPDPKSNLDRLASFAIISDVGIGAKRRQFQRHKEAASLSSISSSGIITEVPSTDAHAKQPTLESPPSATDRIPSKQASFPVSAASGADADKTKTRLVIDDESETRFGTAKGETKARLGSAKARLGKPEVDSDDDFDRLVEINIRELVDETEPRRDGPESMEQRMGAKNQTGTGVAGASGTAGTVGGQQKGQGGRRQLTRFKTQPVTNVEVEKAREMTLHPKTNSEN